MTTYAKPVTGIERDRVMIRAAALRIIRTVLEQPQPKTQRGNRRGLLSPPKLNVFRNLEPLGFGLDKSEWFIFPPRDCTPDVVWPLNTGVIIEHAGDHKRLFLECTYTVSPKDVRGVVTRFSPFMVRQDLAMVVEGTLLTGSGICSWIAGEWINADGHLRWWDNEPFARGFELTEGDKLTPSIATGVALRQRYEWAVSLGLENSPTIRFATDPTGIKDVFRIRDLPKGRDRREALMTWISDHWRQDRHDPEAEIYVRKHLRGATAFNWRGMCGEILPALFDLEQRDILIAKREAMRTEGTDRRIRA